jgi:probable phosphoglycerate mutase
MTKTRIVLIRHGESNVTVQRVLGGPRTCSGLSDLGKMQAERLRDRLANTQELQCDVLYSSGYPRAKETAEIIAPALSSLAINIDARFGEHDPGPECDGLTFAEFVRRHGSPDWGGDPHAEFFPGGETIAQFHQRVYSGLDAILSQHFGKTVVVACHGGVVDAILRRTMRTPQTGAFEVHTKNCSLTEIAEIRAGHWALLRYNDHAHLHGLPVATNID